MRAFGLPIRTVGLGVVVKESVLVGIVATIIGLVGGVVYLQWMLTSLATTTSPTSDRRLSHRPRSSSRRSSGWPPSLPPLLLVPELGA